MLCCPNANDGEACDGQPVDNNPERPGKCHQWDLDNTDNTPVQCMPCGDYREVTCSNAFVRNGSAPGGTCDPYTNLQAGVGHTLVTPPGTVYQGGSDDFMNDYITTDICLCPAETPHWNVFERTCKNTCEEGSSCTTPDNYCLQGTCTDGVCNPTGVVDKPECYDTCLPGETFDEALQQCITIAPVCIEGTACVTDIGQSGACNEQGICTAYECMVNEDCANHNPPCLISNCENNHCTPPEYPSGACTTPDGLNGECLAGACEPVAGICGDGVLNAGEQCDDGNNNDMDACGNCVWVCPDMQAPDGDGLCSEAEACGDGVLNAGEQCDDGNGDNGDGCDNACQLETSDCNGDLDCDDSNLCTFDSCVNGICVHDNGPEEGNSCGPGGVCNNGACVRGF